MNRQVYAIYQLNKYIKSLLDDDVLLSQIFIQGEISNFKLHTSGHMYFTLKDEYASIGCVMFKAYAQATGFFPENGMKVVAFGRVSLYEKTGQYQFYAEDLEPWGKGGLYLAFEQMKIKLGQEGLFEQSRKRLIPYYPSVIAVVTSPDGAAIQDVINVASRRNKKIQIIVAPTLVQGSNAARDIVSAISMINEWGKADVIILARGGGSIEDLWPFNEEIVARAVYNSGIPVVSAVGHETDYCITDFVADLRAPTPSAAAELCVPELDAVKYGVQLLNQRINRALSVKIENMRHEISSLTVRIQPKSFLEALYNRQIYLEQLMEKVNRGIGYKMEMTRLRLCKSMSDIEQLSPVAVLKRGYSLVQGKRGIKTSAKHLAPGEPISIRFHDGVVDAVIEE